MQTRNDKRFLTAAELARTLAVNPRTVQRWCRHESPILEGVDWFLDPSSRHYFLDENGLELIARKLFLEPRFSEQPTPSGTSELRHALGTLDQLAIRGSFAQALQHSQLLSRTADLGELDPVTEELTLHRIQCLNKLGRYAVGLSLSESLLARPWLSDRSRTAALQFFVQCSFHLGSHQSAQRALLALDSLAESHSTPRRRLAVLGVKAALAQVRGDFPSAEPLWRHLVQRGGTTLHHYNTLVARLNLALLYVARGEYYKATPMLSELVGQAGDNNFVRLRALALAHLGLNYLSQRDPVAEVFLHDSLSHARALGFCSLIVWNVHLLELCAADHWNPTPAVFSPSALAALRRRAHPALRGLTPLRRRMVARGAPYTPADLANERRLAVIVFTDDLVWLSEDEHDQEVTKNEISNPLATASHFRRSRFALTSPQGRPAQP